MKKDSVRFFILFFFVFIGTETFADKLEKGFEKLKAFDYFSAKEYFEKTLDDDPAASAFGLSSIFSSNKNPFYNPDSARRYILISDSCYKQTKEKAKKYYSEFGVTTESITKLSEFICEDAFKRCSRQDSVEAYNHYISYFSTCAQFSDAIALRNSAAYENARDANTSVAFKEFMAKYPQAKEYQEAVSKFEERIYDENTSDRTIEAYESFILNFPENPYRSKAERMIYTLSVPGKSISEYSVFARKYKNSRYAEEAWHEVYRLSMKDFSEADYKNFKETYPDYPFPEEFESDYRLQNYFFLPFSEEESWGYINENGQEMISPAYEEASLFAEGVAAVMDEKKYGFINKKGKNVIPFRYDDAESFYNGTAVVMKDSLYGLINKSGEFIIKPEYSELSEAGDDIFIATKNELSGYVKRNGQPLTQFIYDVANDFKNGYAIVSVDEKYGLLNEAGSLNIRTEYEDLAFIGEGLLKAKNEDELYGVVNVQGKIILPFLYDAIGEFSEHRALVSKKLKCGFINESGEIVIPLNFRYESIMMSTGKFKSGYAVLKQKLKSVIVDTAGVPIAFAGVEDYGRPSQGLIPVRKNKKWGFADMSGKIKIPCKYQGADSFSFGFAKVMMNKLSGLVDSVGNVFIQPLYEDINVMEKVIVVRSSEKSGLLTRAGILMLPCNYTQMEFLTPSIVRATDENGFTYVNLDSGKIIYSPTAK